MVAVTIHSDFGVQEEKICPVPNQQQLKWKLAVRSAHYSLHLLCSQEKKEKLIPLFFFFTATVALPAQDETWTVPVPSPSRQLSGTAAGTNTGRIQIAHMQQKRATRETEKVLEGPSLLRQGKRAGFPAGRLHTYGCSRDFMKSFLFTCSSGSASSASLQKPAIWCNTAMRLLERQMGPPGWVAGFEMMKTTVSGRVSKRADWEK